MPVFDSHVHCGLTLPLERIQPLWDMGGIEGGVLFSPVEEIYDRFDPSFVDSPRYAESRENVHQYLESLRSEKRYIFWFVWNDFKIPGPDFLGIKWHRHSHEPDYLYETKECEEIIEHICKRRMPVILEEEFSRTLMMVEKFSGRTVTIIPHFGGLNGGYERLKDTGLFEDPYVYVDTALAGSRQIEDFAATYGVERILFGSDFPFGDPVEECRKVKNIFSGEEQRKVLGENLVHLLKSVRASS